MNIEQKTEHNQWIVLWYYFLKLKRNERQSIDSYATELKLKTKTDMKIWMSLL